MHILPLHFADLTCIDVSGQRWCHSAFAHSQTTVPAGNSDLECEVAKLINLSGLIGVYHCMSSFPNVHRIVLFMQLR